MEQIILDIATKTRNVLENIQNEEGYWYDHNLGGACAIAAYAITYLLKKNKIKSNLIVGMDQSDESGHCWSTFYRNRKTFVIDVTATQFSKSIPNKYEKILILPEDQYHDLPFLREWGIAYFRKGKAAKEYLSTWCEDQQPKTYIDELSHYGIDLS
jgi:hypothetical protein